MYTEWYIPARERFRAQPNGALANPFFNRLRAHVLKLAVVYQVSSSLKLRVSCNAMKRAIQTARSCEESIFSLLPTGLSREGSAVEKMAEAIKAAGPEGMSKSKLTRAFQDNRQSDRDSRLKTLLDAEEVVRFWRRTSGRHAEILVHKDYVAEHLRSFPEDREG